MAESPVYACDGPYVPFIHGSKVDRRAAGKRQRELSLPVYRLQGVLSGRGRLHLDGTDREVGCDQVVLMPPGRTAWMSYAEAGVTVLVHFDVVYQPCRSLRTPLRDCRPPPGWPADEPVVQPPPKDVWGVDLDPGPYDGLAEPLQTICEEWRAGGADMLKLQSAHHRLQGVLLRLVATNAPQVAPGSLYRRILHAESLAFSFRNEEFGVAQFAAAAGLSTSHFALVYRRLRGRTPGAFLAGIKLQRAQSLMILEGLTVAETARGVGFRSVSAFTRFFRRHTGRSPERWRAARTAPERQAESILSPAAPPASDPSVP